MTSDNSQEELEVLQGILTGLSGLDKDAQIRIVQTAATFLGIDIGGADKPRPRAVSVSAAAGEAAFSDREQMSPKEFMLEKEPRTDVERVACLAYYLTHYRDTPHFKTLDISKLNTEAAQRKFANAAYAVRNATTAGLLVQAARGQKLLSAIGEQFVQALPDREAAKEVKRRMRPSRARKTRTSTRKSKTTGHE